MSCSVEEHLPMAWPLAPVCLDGAPGLPPPKRAKNLCTLSAAGARWPRPPSNGQAPALPLGKGGSTSVAGPALRASEGMGRRCCVRCASTLWWRGGQAHSLVGVQALFVARRRPDSWSDGIGCRPRPSAIALPPSLSLSRGLGGE